MSVNYSDILEFSEHKFFKYLHDYSGVTRATPRNILQCKNGLLFGWDGKNYTLLILYVRKSDFQNAVLQKLIPTETPIFEINRIAVNNKLNKCALSGPRGVCILEVTLLSAASTDEHESEVSSLANCHFLDEDYFQQYPSLTILQVRWHPNRFEENVLVVLTSENALRLYSANTKQLLKICSFFKPDPAGVIHSKNRILLASFGETAVDFDFGPPLEKGYSVKTDFIYPTFILKGNGDVCCVKNLLENGSNGESPTIEGPLIMYPPSSDNYDIDEASSIIVVWSMPPILVLATSTGVLYHTIIVEEDETDANCSVKSDSASEKDDSTIHESSSLYLITIGALEPEMGITINAEKNELTSQPVTLYKDPIVRSRYFCTHQGGVHLINLESVISPLENFANSKDSDAHILISGATESFMKYLICTRLQLNSLTLNSGPLVGFTVVDSSSTIAIGLLSHGDVGMVVIDSSIWNPKNLQDVFLRNDKKEDDKEQDPECLDMHVQNFFQKLGGKAISDLPLFKLNIQDNVSDTQTLEFLNVGLRDLKNVHLPTLMKACELIKTRTARLLETQKEHLEELDKLERNQVSMHHKAEYLAERYEELAEKREEISNKFNGLFKMILGGEKKPNSNEMNNEMTELNKRVSKLQDTIREIRRKRSQFEILQNEQKPEVNSSVDSKLTAGSSSVVQDFSASSEQSTSKFASNTQDNIFQLNVENMLSMLQSLQLKLSLACDNLQ